MRTMCTWLCVVLAAAALVAGCRDKSPRRQVPPPRIVTYAPALTAMTFDMGLGEHVVGVTSQCILPPGQKCPSLGDAMNPSAESILAVDPDVVLIQQDPARFATLKKLRPQVRLEHFDIERLADIPAAMERIGQICGDTAAGDKAVREFRERLDAVVQRVRNLPRPRVLFVMGYDSPSTGGRDSFVHEMIEAAGGTDVCEKYKRWAKLDMESILSLSPDVLVCWVDPGQEDRARAHWQAFKTLPAVASGRVFAVSDRFWTIPAGHTAKCVSDLADMIHPKPQTGGPKP